MPLNHCTQVLDISYTPITTILFTATAYQISVDITSHLCGDPANFERRGCLRQPHFPL